MAEKGILGLLYSRIVRTTEHSLNDLVAVLKIQEAFRYEVVACLALIPVAFWLVAQSL